MKVIHLQHLTHHFKSHPDGAVDRTEVIWKDRCSVHYNVEKSFLHNILNAKMHMCIKCNVRYEIRDNIY